MAQEFFTRIIFSCGIQSAASLWEQLKYFKNLNQNVETLRDMLEDLNCQEGDVKEEIEKAMVLQGKKRKRVVTVWQENVKRIKREVGDIELIFQEGSFFSRLRLGKLVREKIEQVSKLRQMGDFSNGMKIEPLSRGHKLPTTKNLVGETAKRIIEEVLKWLKNANVGMIGVWGMGGIGKTTVMNYINNDLVENNAFKYVIWVTVSKALDLKTLQNDIARSIGTRLLEDDYEDNRAALLHSTLERMKNSVIILDGLWKAFPLEKIGIPTFNQDNGSRMMITTRSLDVCGAMGTDKEIDVELLSEEEAWELFKINVGGDVMSSSEIQDVAKQVVQECGRLPLAIITVGRAMSRVDDVKVWRNALKELRRSSPDIRNMDCHVFRPLKFSYDRLRNDNIRACFLYCALFSSRIFVPELIEHWVCEGLIHDEGDRGVNEDKAHAILTELKHASLLENTEYVYLVNMHDLVRDMAIHITKTSPRFMVKAGVGLTKAPEEDEWTENTERVSLAANNIYVLSGHPKCPKLTTFFLQGNNWLTSISDSFFLHMHQLRVVDLSDTDIETLPKSVSNLVNLRALILKSCCELKKLPSLAKLTSLMVMDLQYCSEIEELPEGMEMLTNLRRLVLIGTTRLQIFPAGVISKLLLLKELLLFNSLCTLNGEENIIDEIISFTRLDTLSFSFSEVNTFLKYVESKHWEELHGFDFSIGERPSLSVNYYFHGGNCVRIHLCYNLSPIQFPPVLPGNTRKLVIIGCEFRALSDRITAPERFSNLKELDIEHCRKLKSLFSWTMLQNVKNLKKIRVAFCNKIETIIGGEEEGEEGSDNGTVTLPKLEKIKLARLPNLKSICNNKVLVSNSLRLFEAIDCSNLKKLPFSETHLPPALKMIIGEKEWLDSLQWNDPITMTNLRTLFQQIW